MYLRELEQKDIETSMYDPSEDKYNTLKPTDTRKKRLFLSDLNRIKKMRATQELERLKRIDLLGVMYGAPEADAGGGPPGGGLGF